MANNAILGAMLLLIKTKADTSGLNKTDKALRKTGSAIKSMSKDIGLIGKLSKGFLGYLGVRGIGGIFNSYLQFEKDYGAMKSRFYAITKDEGLAQEEFNYIKGVAVETANSIKAVADSYSIFYAAARRPLGQEGARSIFETWTKVSRVLHLSEAQFERVTYALREMSSKGQLYSQDLKIQLGTHVPDAINIAETAIQNLGIKGVETVEDFQKLTKKEPRKGWMAKFLLEFSKEAGKRFASPEALKKALAQPDALQQSILLLKDLFLYEFSDAGGNKAIINILTGIRNALMQIDYKGMAKSLAKIAEGVSSIFNYLPLIFEVLKDIAVSLIIMNVFRGIAKGIRYIHRVMTVLAGRYMQASLMFFQMTGKVMPSLGKFAMALTKNSIKTWITGLLGVSGPLGWVAGALIFLPELVSIVKWFASKLGYNKKEEIAKTPLGSVYEVAKKLEQDKNINSTEKLQEALAKNEATKTLWAGAQYHDNGKITIYIDGAKTVEEIGEMASKEIAKNIKESKVDSIFGLWKQRPDTLNYRQ